MSTLKWLGTKLMPYVLYCAVTALVNESARGFDEPPNFDGEPMTPPQALGTGLAIAGIATGPPDSITWQDVDSNVYSASCSTIAADLLYELQHGQIQQEVQNDGAPAWEWEGEINVNDDLLDSALVNNDDLKHLEEILVHEWVHKQQDGIISVLRCTECSGKEVEAADAELAYKDSTGVPPSSRHYLAAVDYQFAHWVIYWFGQWWKTYLGRISVDGGGLILEIRQGDPPASDMCFAYHSGDTLAQEVALDPLRCTDFDVIQHYFPNGNALMIACGFEPGLGGRLQTYEVSDSIVGLHSTLVFTPYFYAIERAEFDSSFIILDTATTTLHRLVDTNSDIIPDVIAGEFASVQEFPQLEGTRSVQTAIHPTMGIGLIVNPASARFYHVKRPYEMFWFLVDADGNHEAESCIPVHRYEFIQAIPQIREVPYAGDISVRVFGTWHHNIAVYTTDETGEILMEMLGMVFLEDSVEASCPISLPLVAGEYIIPVDLVSNQRSGSPVQIRDIVPKALVILFDVETGMLNLSWEALPVEVDYALYASDDGEDFYDTGLRTEENHFVIPLPPFEKQFYYVTTIR